MTPPGRTAHADLARHWAYRVSSDTSGTRPKGMSRPLEAAPSGSLFLLTTVTRIESWLPQRTLPSGGSSASSLSYVKPLVFGTRLNRAVSASMTIGFGTSFFRLKPYAAVSRKVPSSRRSHPSCRYSRELLRQTSPRRHALCLQSAPPKRALLLGLHQRAVRRAQPPALPAPPRARPQSRPGAPGRCGSSPHRPHGHARRADHVRPCPSLRDARPRAVRAGLPVGNPCFRSATRSFNPTG